MTAAPPPAPSPDVSWWNPRAWGQTFAALENPAYARYFWGTFAFFFAATMVFNMPARQAMVPALVGPERLMNAIALMSGSMNVCRIVAPALAGVLVGPLGVGGAYIVTMAINAVAVLLFVGIRGTARETHSRRTFLGDLVDGVSYIRADRLLLLLLLVGIVPMLLAMPHQNLLPVFAVSVWEVGAVGLGLLQTLAGIGGLAGAVVAANLGGVRRPGRVMTSAIVLFGVFIALFASSPAFAPALVLILVSELFAMVGQTLNNTIVQASIPDAVRGRVMSLMMMTFGVTPLGTLPAGWVAEQYGVRVAVGGGGLLLILFAALLYLASPTLRTLDNPAPSRTVADLRPLKPSPGAVGD